MKKNYLVSKILLLLFLSSSGIYEAQQAIIPAGNNAQSGTGSFSYSIGQIFYEPQMSGTGKVNPGVQQPYEIFTLATSQNEINHDISVYPNPIKDFLIVDFNSEKLEKSRFELFDGTGRIINSGDLKNIKSEINTSNLSAGLYLLNISNAGKKIKIFKIIKNK